MSRWDTPFYNSERYHDPTAGAAILSVIRSERQKAEWKREKERRNRK